MCEELAEQGDSPVSNNGRGLKLNLQIILKQVSLDSPVSNNGRGLKLIKTNEYWVGPLIRPLAITGVD